MRRLIFLAAIAMLSASFAAQAETAIATIVAARSAVERGDWKAAVVPLAALVAQSPQNGEFRIGLARARYYTGDFMNAETDYQAAYDLKAVDPAIAAYGIARCAARLGDRAGMLKWLGIATSLGLRRLEDARGDDDFAAYRNDPDFRRLMGIVDVSRMSRDEGWRGDIAFLADWVEKKSFHPFRTETGDRVVSNATATREQFRAAVAKLEADVPKLSDRAIELALFRLVAELGDGHSAVYGSPTRMEYGLTLPLGFYLFDDGLYIVSAAPAHADLIGAKVLAVDGMPVSDVLAKIAPLIGRDNMQWFKAMEPHYLRHVPFLKELGVTKAENAAELSLRMRDGKETSVHIAADVSQPDIWNALPKPTGWSWIGDGSKSGFQQDNDKPFWWKWEPHGSTLYVQYNKIEDTKGQSLAAFAQDLSAAIAKYPAKKLVIDMRNNNGGDTYLNEPLLFAVAASRLNGPGHLYVIIGRRTFSAAMNAVSYFGRFTKTIFVGEPTGGKPNAPGDETPFSLPYSGIVVNLSDRYWQGSWPDDFSDFRAPDIAVPQIFTDYAVGRDAAMQTIEAQPVPTP